MKIDQLGEFGLIERIRSALPAPGPGVVEGIGDDVAVLEAGGDNVWLATCDVLVEGSHFLRDAIPPRRLGRKALAVNLSDVASAGGFPRFALVSLGLPPDLDVQFIDELYAGLREEGTRFGAQVVGGNISRSRQGMFIDVFLLGEAPRGNVVLRSGACRGTASCSPEAWETRRPGWPCSWTAACALPRRTRRRPSGASTLPCRA